MLSSIKCTTLHTIGHNGPVRVINKVNAELKPEAGRDDDNTSQQKLRVSTPTLYWHALVPTATSTCSMLKKHPLTSKCCHGKPAKGTLLLTGMYRWEAEKSHRPQGANSSPKLLAQQQPTNEV